MVFLGVFIALLQRWVSKKKRIKTEKAALKSFEKGKRNIEV